MWGSCDEVKALFDGAVALGENIYSAVENRNLGAVLDIISGFLPERCALNASFEFDYCAGCATAAIIAEVVTSGAGAVPQLGMLEKVGDLAPTSLDDAVTSVRRHLPDCGGNSFVPGTRVLLADGTTKPIEDIQIGDLVWATDPETGEAGPRPVTDLITGTGDKSLVDITINGATINGATITAIDQQPIWVNNQGQWVDAEDLQPGDYLLDYTGITLLVDTVDVRHATEQTAHNLTVHDLHTYHVSAGGDLDVLTHNWPSGVAYDPYRDVGGHHLNQDAAYRDVIPHRDGMTTPLSGNAFTQPGTPHYQAHADLEVFWNQYRKGGAKYGELPTNVEYSQALLNSLRAGSKTDTEAWGLTAAAMRQQIQYGLLGGQTVPRIPGRINLTIPPFGGHLD
jgi:hypothetical protein